MIYLLDANILIAAKNNYYEFGRVDQYWEWLAHEAGAGNVKIPLEIFEEITIGQDELATWARSNREALVLNEDVDVALVQRVTTIGYAPDLTDIEIETIGRDPFLVAYALADIEYRIVVTGEVRTNRQRQNRSIPSICDDFNVLSCDQWQLSRDLNFRI